MHNLFLGTAKHVMSLWKDREIIKKEHFTIIQDRVDNLNVPMDIGRIPSKIESAMAGLTADQWKNWTCIFSLYILHDILPRDHLHCWWLFVQACYIVCQPIISKEISFQWIIFCWNFVGALKNYLDQNHVQLTSTYTAIYLIAC